MGVGARLNLEDELRAAAVGYERQQIAVRAENPPRHRGGSLWGGHIESACAELAVSNYTGLPWTGETIWQTPPAERLPDVGEQIEVRWTTPSDRYERVLNYDPLRDDPCRFFVLVTGYSPIFVIHGYIIGRDAAAAGQEHVYPERTVIKVPAHKLKALSRSQ